VIAVFAGINGYLDDLEVSRVRAFEEALYRHLDGPGRPVARRLIEKKAIDDEMKAELRKLLDAFRTDFAAKAAAA
jgi:F-type H+-transporting ATPase subunit alpha